MGETAEYQRLQEAAEGDDQQLPSDEEEVPAPCLMVVVVEQTDGRTDKGFCWHLGSCRGVR